MTAADPLAFLEGERARADAECERITEQMILIDRNYERLMEERGRLKAKLSQEAEVSRRFGIAINELRNAGRRR